MYCQKCNCEMKFVPAGVSRKTNKPYDSFWVCQNQECKATMKDNQVDNIINNIPKTQPQVNGKPIDHNSMILTYAKDVVVAEIGAGKDIQEPFKRIADGFKALLVAYKYPFKQ